jgi:hypothetical protein
MLETLSNIVEWDEFGADYGRSMDNQGDGALDCVTFGAFCNSWISAWS